jgi:hypothetical protein
MEAWRWDLIRDAWQVVLCIGILVCLVRGRGAPLRAPRKSGAPPDVAEFNQEIRLQALRQESERTLAVILETVESERRRLQQAFEADGRSGLAAAAVPARPATDEPAFCLGERPEPAAWGRYDGVHGLAREGLSCRQIAEKLNLPRGEVELALKLRPASG